MRNERKFNLRVSAISLAVASLFMATAAMADEEEVKALTQPKSSVVVEAISVDQSSATFGEYNGLNRAGGYVNGGFVVKQGDAYTGNEQGDTSRWSVYGDNLGLTTRSAGAGYSDQGSWNLNLNYDELQHNISNSYQTPYQGTMGGNSFRLPSGFGVVNTSQTNGGTAYNAAKPNLIPTVRTGAQNMTANQINSFGNMNISTTRNNTTLSGGAEIDKNSGVTFEYNNLIQTGAKLQSVPGAGMGGKGVITGESPTILPSPTNYQTDTLNVAYNWKSDAAHFTASYFGSYFQDANNSFNFQPWAVGTGVTGSANNLAMQQISTAPSNMLNQLNIGGGYNIASKTKLTGNASISKNTQNASFAYDPYMMISPSAGGLPLTNSSMNGLVNTTHFDVKLTDQTVKDLALVASYKFDERDNLTQSNVYSFSGVGTAAATATSAQPAFFPNTPLSYKQQQAVLGGDYKITRDQKASLNYTYNNMQRWCNQYGTTMGNTNQPVAPANNVYPAGTNCVVATANSENKIDALYKIKAMEGLNFKAGVGYSKRNATLDPNAIANYATANPNNTPAQRLLPGQNGQDYYGFVPFFEAARNQFVAKGTANWDATEQLSFTLGGKYTNDTYPRSTYGVQNGNSWSVNLDGTYAYSETGSLTAFATQQSMQRNLSNLLQTQSATAYNTAYAGGWTNNLTSNATTLGLGVKQGGLMGGNVTLFGDLLYSMASSWYSTNVNYPVSATTTCNSPNVMSCGILPAIQNNMGAIKLGGSYKIDKNQKVGFMYWYQHLYSNDFYYNGLQYPNNPTAVLPTNQSNPSYNVNVFSLNYTYTFD